MSKFELFECYNMRTINLCTLHIMCNFCICESIFMRAYGVQNELERQPLKKRNVDDSDPGNEINVFSMCILSFLFMIYIVAIVAACTFVHHAISSMDIWRERIFN